MAKENKNIIIKEKVPIGPLWYITVLVAVIISIYLMKKAPLVALPVIGGAFLIILVETIFTYPISYMLTDDSLIAKSGLIFRHEILYNEIEEMEAIPWYKLYFYVGGNRIAGMPKGEVIIINPQTDRLITTPGKETLAYLLKKTQLHI